MSIITVPFSWLLMTLYDMFQNYGIAIILFALVVNLILTPFMGKSKQSMLRQQRLQPRLKELERRHGANQQKYQQEVQKLYQEEKINPMSGCLWSLIPFPILIALYSVIREPMSVMMGMSEEAVQAVQTTLEKLGAFSMEGLSSQQQAYHEIFLSQAAHENLAAVQAVAPEFQDISYSFLGLNLGVTPNWKIWEFDFSSAATLLPAIGLFLIPIISATLSYLSMKVSMARNDQGAAEGAQAAQAESMNKSMSIMMPLMSIWICFIMPAAMGIYWIANSVFGMIRDWVLTKYYTKKMLVDDVEWLEREKRREAEEAEYERKRVEAERRKAAGIIEDNKNTSKKKQKAAEKQKKEELKAAAIAADKAERRERLGVQEAEIPASQVGNRRYARGRAYDPDRFNNEVNGSEE
ncbi:MAG: YidC/Oxa1 family membrane protein insertase [Oscillospiraceae bacterium]|nr:YidC/Oxa1 family membrane protein insertase [Oscillospiraceae bacterium]